MIFDFAIRRDTAKGWAGKFKKYGENHFRPPIKAKVTTLFQVG
jgi:hypothetical protein